MSRRIMLIEIGNGLTLSGVLPSVALYADYSARLVAGGGAPPYTYTLLSGSLPSGLYLDAATGFIIGSPTEAGRFPIVIRSTDLTGSSVQRSFVVQVIAEPLTIYGDAGDGTVGVTQSFTYFVTGGAPPISYALVDAPIGMSIPDPNEPTIVYTPASSGSKSWRIVGTDGNGDQAEHVDAINVSDNGNGAQYPDWRYLQTSLSDATDYSSPGFDDSSWLVGAAPFGDLSEVGGSTASPPAFDARFASEIATHSNLDQRLWIRRNFETPVVHDKGYRLIGYLDNAYVLYLNGVQVASGSSTLGGGSKSIIPGRFMVPGTNAIAVRCDDDAAHGGTDSCYFDFILEPADETDITAALLHFDGPNNSTTFNDETGTVWTRNGAAAISTTKSKFGGASGHFGLNDSIVATSDLFNLTGDATIECFYSADSLSADRGLFFFGAASQDANRIQLYVQANGAVAFFGNLSNTTIFWPITAAGLIVPSVMNHIAAEIRGGVASIYVNGVLEASASFSGRPAVSSRLVIAAARTANTGRFAFGYIDEARVTNGVCRYGDEFDPPTAAFSYP